MAPRAHIISLNSDDHERPRTATADKCFEHRGMNNIRHMNDLVAVGPTSPEVDEIECFIDKTAVAVVGGSGTCGTPLRTTEL